MNNLINKILKEAEEDDSFFQPKDIGKRKEEQKRRIEEKKKIVFSKAKSGLQNIKITYENKNWDSEAEKLFLQIFSTLHLNEKYDKKWNEYLLKNENNENVCLFDLKNDVFWISYGYIWKVFEKKFHWKYDEIKHFMKNMLNEHFKLYEFTPQGCLSSLMRMLNEHFKLYEFTPYPPKILKFH